CFDCDDSSRHRWRRVSDVRSGNDCERDRGGHIHLYMKPLVRSLLAVVALAAFCGAASAAILVVNCGTVSGPAELAAASVLCPQFNLAGQTVSSISINISGGI